MKKKFSIEEHRVWAARVREAERTISELYVTSYKTYGSKSPITTNARRAGEKLMGAKSALDDKFFEDTGSSDPKTSPYYGEG